jgi:tetratricopeptide (TPR) repeat protein
VRQQPCTAPTCAGNFLAGGLLVIAALVAYHNSFSVPFIYDDTTAIPGNLTIQHLWPIGPVLSPPASLTTSGRPVVNLSLAINYAFGRTNVRGYHALNLAIHILAALTLFGIVRRTLLGPVLRERFGASARLLALTIAAIWMLHPLQTESVTYTIQRAESLMGLFYLLTLYCFLRSVEKRNQVSSSFAKATEDRGVRCQDTEDQKIGSQLSTLSSQLPALNPLSSVALAKEDQLSTFNSRGWKLASILCCFLGMACKEVMVSAPLMVLLYDRTFVAGSFRQAWQKRRCLYLGLAASWLLLGYLVASTGGSRNGSAGFDSGISWWTYALTQLGAIVHYLRLSLWPHPLIFDYGTNVVKQAVEIIPYALVVATMVAGTIIGLRRWPAIGFAGVWFFAILAPSSSIVPVATETMAEHRMYLPLAAVAALVVLGIYTWAGRLGAYVLLASAFLLGFVTLQRNEDYHSAVSIWGDTVAKLPGNPRAHNDLGEALSVSNRIPEALQQYQEAVRLKPTYPDYHYNLGMALSGLGRVQEALGQFEEALQLKSDDAKTHESYGLALMKSGQAAKAIDQYQEALRLNPDSAEAHINLGIALGQAGQLPEAIAQFEEALRINPDDAKAHNNLGYACLQTGSLEDARAQFEEAVRLNPDFAEAHNNLALALDKLGRTSGAIEQYAEVLRLDPDYAEAHYNLGLDLALLGRIPEAIAQLQEALRLKPDYVQARNKLAQLQTTNY